MGRVRRIITLAAVLVVAAGVLSAAPAEAAANPLPSGSYTVKVTGDDCGLYSVSGAVLAVNGTKASLKVAASASKKLTLAGSAARHGKTFAVSVKSGRTMTASFVGTRAASGKLSASVQTGGVNPSGETGWFCATKVTLAPVPKKMGAATPAIVGAAKVGRILTAKHGNWKPSGVTFSYQWLRDKDPIAKATKSSYKVVKADAGSKITVTVTAKKSGYAVTSRTSKATSIPAAKGPKPKIVQVAILDTGIVAKGASGKQIGTTVRLASTHAVAKLLVAALGKPRSHAAYTGPSPWTGMGWQCSTEEWRWPGASGTVDDGIDLEYESEHCYFGLGTLVVNVGKFKGVRFVVNNGVSVGTSFAAVKAKGWKGTSCSQSYPPGAADFFYYRPGGLHGVVVTGDPAVGVKRIYDNPHWQSIPCFQ